MKTLTEYFRDYAKSHKHPVNKTIHYWCIPAIVFSLLLILKSFSFFIVLALVTCMLIFYWRLSPALAVGAFVSFLLFMLVSPLIPAPLYVGITIFLLAWVGQFYGHYLEGAKPSFFQDLFFLLIGPLWVLAAVFERLGLLQFSADES